jgi:hypothetical protein
LEKNLENQKDMIRLRTNSKKIEIVNQIPSKKFQHEIKDKIKESEISIYFDKI